MSLVQFFVSIVLAAKTLSADGNPHLLSPSVAYYSKQPTLNIRHKSAHRRYHDTGQRICCVFVELGPRLAAVIQNVCKS